MPVSGRDGITAYPGKEYGELSDLENDPHELRSLWDDSGHQEIEADLLIQLMERIVLTDSALPRRLCHA
jgi:hypothetical protein